MNIKEDLYYKLTSRKFILALGASLAFMGESLAGLAGQNSFLTFSGMICTAISIAAYSIAEGYKDGKRAEAEQTVTTISKAVTATATDKATVQQVLAAEAEVAAKTEVNE